jgi:hypothetical protein
MVRMLRIGDHDDPYYTESSQSPETSKYNKNLLRNGFRDTEHNPDIQCKKVCAGVNYTFANTDLE